MHKSKVTPKDFFLWAGAMIALYWSVFSFIRLFFDYINYVFPDPLNSYIDPYSSSIRNEMASLIVLFPLFLLLMYFIRRDIAHDAGKKELWVRRWALVLTIFVAGVTIAIDLITLINTFLGGELTTPFLLKIAIVLLVAGGGLFHFLADLWGYWSANPRYARTMGGAAALVVILTIAAGFFIVGTPGQIRLYRFDDQKVNDLQSIQSEVVTYWQEEQKLPATLSDLADSISGFTVPADAQSGAQYDYKITGALSFELCANFNAPTQDNSPTITQSVPMIPSPVGATGPDLANDSWYHGAGETCFDRTIDPARYPALNKTP